MRSDDRMVLQLILPFTDIDKGLSVPLVDILWMSAWASQYLPHGDTVAAVALGIVSNRKRVTSCPWALFKKRENNPQKLLNRSAFMLVGQTESQSHS